MSPVPEGTETSVAVLHVARTAWLTQEWIVFGRGRRKFPWEKDEQGETDRDGNRPEVAISLLFFREDSDRVMQHEYRPAL